MLHKETCQLIYITNQITGFSVIQVLTKRFFQTNFSLVKHIIELMQIMLSKQLSQHSFFYFFSFWTCFFVNIWSGYVLKHFKGNPNSQGVLNWIIKILHYYYSKQHKNIKNSQIIEQNLVIFYLCSSLCLLRPTLPLPSQAFQFFKRHKWSFVKYIVSFFDLKKPIT